MCLTIGHADEHEPATANISRRRMHHRQGKAGGHRRIHGIAAFAHDLDACFGGFFVNADHNGMLFMDGTQPTC